MANSRSFFHLIAACTIALSGLVSACHEPVVFEQNADMPEGRWNVSQKVKLEFDISDTVSQHHFFLNLRNTPEYPYSNLYVFVTTVFPNDKRSIDTVACVLADQTGRWLGKGNGFVFDNQIITNRIMYKYGKRFPMEGAYVVFIEQAMRDEELPGILNVGLRIEKMQP